MKHWLKLVPDTRGAQRLLVKDMTELAGRIRDEADKLLAELEGTGITHDILKTIRAVIETRSTHLAYLPEEEFAPHLEEGRLTRVLEDWCPPFLGYHLYYPSRRQPSPAFLLVVDALRMEAPSRPTTERGTFAQAVPVDMRRPAEVVASR